MSSRGIILAGGRGSRLGPITAQRSKALVTVGQRPILIHQLLLLRDAGVLDVVVVVSPDTANQVVEVVQRAGVVVPAVRFVTQDEPRGPVDALRVGLASLTTAELRDGIFMLASDSFLDEPLLLGDPSDRDDWVGVAPAPVERSFCFEDSGVYHDDRVDVGELVTIAVNYFTSARYVLDVASELVEQWDFSERPEIQMSAFFNVYKAMQTIDDAELRHRHLNTWLDVGDVDALARAHRSRFISRSHHRLELDASGVIVKYGEGEPFERQLNWLLERRDCMIAGQANLVPRVHDVSRSTKHVSWYSMEYVDLPTLAELWLYWPGLPSVWQALLRNVLTQLRANLWVGTPQDEPTANVLWFVDKTRDRLAMRGLPEWHAVAEPLLDEAEELLRGVTHTELVRGHGDLNFSNILYSLNSGMIKLIDPRGDHLVPWLYELTKLRFSYHGGYAAITHGLASLSPGNGVVVWPERSEEITALDDVIAEYVDLDVLTVCEGCCMLSSAPLHEGVESEMLFWRGIELLRQVLKP